MSEGAGHMNHITKWGAKLRGVPEQDIFSCPVAWEFGSVWRTFSKLPSLVSGMGGLDHSGDCEISFLPFCCLLYRLPGAVWRILLCFFKGDGQKKQCGHPADEDLGSRGGIAWKNKPSRDCGHTEAGTGRNIYIYIFFFYSGLLFTKGKKSELKMLQYFPSEHTHSSVWRIHMNWL